MSIESTILEMAKAAKQAAAEIACCSSVKKNEALLRIAEKLEQDAGDIQRENKKDLDLAAKAGSPPP